MRQVRRSPLEETLRQILVARREEGGLTQAQLASALRRPQSYVSKVERGERRLEIIEFIAYANALGSAPEGIIKRLSEAYKQQTDDV